MIEAGDLVRFKNAAIRRGGVLCRINGHRMFRGDQRIIQVLRVLRDRFDPVTGSHTRLVELDYPGRHEEYMRVDVRWLAVFKKAAKIRRLIYVDFPPMAPVHVGTDPAQAGIDNQVHQADILWRYAQQMQSSCPGDILERWAGLGVGPERLITSPGVRIPKLTANEDEAAFENLLYNGATAEDQVP